LVGNPSPAGLWKDCPVTQEHSGEYIPDFQVVRLLVSNFHWGSGSIKGKHLQLPFQRNRRGAITLGFVTSLI